MIIIHTNKRKRAFERYGIARIVIKPRGWVPSPLSPLGPVGSPARVYTSLVHRSNRTRTHAHAENAFDSLDSCLDPDRSDIIHRHPLGSHSSADKRASAPIRSVMLLQPVRKQLAPVHTMNSLSVQYKHIATGIGGRRCQWRKLLRGSDWCSSLLSILRPPPPPIRSTAYTILSYVNQLMENCDLVNFIVGSVTTYRSRTNWVMEYNFSPGELNKKGRKEKRKESKFVCLFRSSSHERVRFSLTRIFLAFLEFHEILLEG